MTDDPVLLADVRYRRGLFEREGKGGEVAACQALSEQFAHQGGHDIAPGVEIHQAVEAGLDLEDAGKLTVAQRDAGGALVAALLSRPDTASIPRAAIIESGPLEAVPVARAARVTQATAKKLKVPATREAFAAGA